MCKGIENYSAVLSGRAPGSMPTTLLDYFPDDFLLFVDESHVTLPQVRAMYGGDYARKKTLVEYGFRLPSAFDNRPLKFEEVESKLNQMIFVSATPATTSGRTARRWRSRSSGPPAFWTRSFRCARWKGRWWICWARSIPYPAARARSRDHADQENGRRPDRLPYRTGHQGQVYAPRGGYL